MRSDPESVCHDATQWAAMSASRPSTRAFSRIKSLTVRACSSHDRNHRASPQSKTADLGRTAVSLPSRDYLAPTRPHPQQRDAGVHARRVRTAEAEPGENSPVARGPKRAAGLLQCCATSRNRSSGDNCETNSVTASSVTVFVLIIIPPNHMDYSIVSTRRKADQKTPLPTTPAQKKRGDR